MVAATSSRRHGVDAVVEPRHRLLADVAALGEVDGAIDYARLGGHSLLAHLAAEARAPRFHPPDLGCLLAHRDGPRGLENLFEPVGRLGPRDQIDPEVRGHGEDVKPYIETLCVLTGEGARSRRLARLRTDHGDDRPAIRDILNLCPAPDLVGVEMPVQGGGGVGLGVEPDVAAAQAQDAHVGLHVALAIE